MVTLKGPKQREETEPRNGRNGLLRGGQFVLRYGLAFVLGYVGLLKFTSYEAQGIEKYATNSPLTSWLYAIFSSQTASKVIGSWEIASALLIALRRRSATASAVGSAMAVIQSFVTLSFSVTTPGVWKENEGGSIPVMSEDPGQFLAKDILLLGAALMTLGEALQED